jgi:hypothetical protein
VVDLELKIADGVLTDLDALDAVVVGMVPAFRGLDELVGDTA